MNTVVLDITVGLASRGTVQLTFPFIRPQTPFPPVPPFTH